MSATSFEYAILGPFAKLRASVPKSRDAGLDRREHQQVGILQPDKVPHGVHCQPFALFLRMVLDPIYESGRILRGDDRVIDRRMVVADEEGRNMSPMQDLILHDTPASE